MRGIGPAGKSLQAVGLRAHQRRVKVPSAVRIETPLVEFQRGVKLGAGGAASGSGVLESKTAGPIIQISFHRVPKECLVMDAGALDVTGERGIRQRPGDAALPVRPSGDVLWFRHLLRAGD